MSNFKFHEQPINFNVKFGEIFTVARSEDDGTYILVTQDGQEIPAAVVKELTVFDATANDIREGKIAATETGVTVGTKFIPSYQTTQGVKIIMPDSPLSIVNLIGEDTYDYTKLQTIICLYNTELSNSVAAEMVSIDDSVYYVQSSEPVSSVTKNTEAKSIELNVSNTFGKPCVIRYFTYKEIE